MSDAKRHDFQCDLCGQVQQGWAMPDGRLICPRCSPPILVESCKDDVARAERIAAVKAGTAHGAATAWRWLYAGVAALLTGAWWLLKGTGKVLLVLWIGIGNAAAALAKANEASGNWGADDEDEDEDDEDWDDEDWEDDDGAWRDGQPSVKQLAFLLALDAPIRRGMSAGEASDTITRYKSRDRRSEEEGKEAYYDELHKLEDRLSQGETIDNLIEDLARQ